jgi:ketosteroid isomerase-like protein
MISSRRIGRWSSWLAGFLVSVMPLAVFPGPTAATPGTEQTVLDYVAAFNRQDVDGMLRLATDKILWLSVSGETVIRETADAQALDAAMRDYFSRHTSSHSTIIQIHSSGSWVTTLERAGHMVDGQLTKGKCSYAMYLLEDGLIGSVWYFPAHDCDG